MDERGSRHASRPRTSEEGSGTQAPASASGASNRKRSEATRFSSANDDKVGGVRDAAPPVCRRRWRNNAFAVPLAPTKTAATERASAASAASNQTGRDPQRAKRAIKHRIARRRAEEERGDTLLVGERRQSRRRPGAIRSERSEQSNRALVQGRLGVHPESIAISWPDRPRTLVSSVPLGRADRIGSRAPEAEHWRPDGVSAGRAPQDRHGDDPCGQSRDRAGSRRRAAPGTRDRHRRLRTNAQREDRGRAPSAAAGRLG